MGINLIQLKNSDLKRQLEMNDTNTQNIRSMTDSIILVRTKIFAELIKKDASILEDKRKLEFVKKILDADEVHVSDENGVLVASVPSHYEGYNMANSKQSAAFLPALKDKHFEFVQEPMKKGISNESFQYAGVARRDKKGIVQVGLNPKRLSATAEITDVKKIADTYRIGKDGFNILIKDNKIVSRGINGAIDTKEEIDEIIKKSEKFNSPFETIIDGRKFLGLSRKWEEYTIVGLLPEDELYQTRNSMLLSIVVVNFLLFVVMFFMITILLKKVIISGIQKINFSLKKITNGDLEEKVEVNKPQEFSELSKGINSTVTALKSAIAEAEARIDAELEFAKAIQQSSLPTEFPPYPDKTEFSIYATMDMAREVGGDFYDFFLIDDNHLAFLIADVAGKGIPAALFMMTTKTIIKNVTKTGKPLNEVMEIVNNQIFENNEKSLFVTAFLLVLELSTGKLTYVNAGHNLPLIKRADGKFEFIKSPSNLVIGGIKGIKYESCTTELKQNDCILLYTDGVTEALNKDEEMFGEKRFIDFVNKPEFTHVYVEDLLNSINKKLTEFAQGTEQSDDITLLALKYKAIVIPTEKKSYEANKNNMHDIVAWSEEYCDKLKMDEMHKMKFSIAIEELFSNISNYAYPDASGNVEIELSTSAEKKEISAKFTDSGVPYNPLAKKDPNINLPAQDRQIGGLGILMVKKSMDSVSYSYENDLNILVIKMNY